MEDVHVGKRVIIGAGSIVTKDIPDNSVAVGNSAKVVCGIDEYLAKEKAKMRPENSFVGIGYEKETVAKAIAAADKYGEIFVSGE